MNASYAVADPYAPKNLIQDGDKTTRKVTILSGQVLLAGTVLGAILAAASATATAGATVSGSGATPGNGVMGAVTTDAGAMAGQWRVVITNAVTNAGAFEVVRPDGSIDGVGTVAVAYNGQLNFTLADGATDFAEDDFIPITVSYAAGLKYIKSIAAATDGSQTPDLVLAEDADASGGDLEAIAYETATVVKTALTLGAGHTVDSIRAGLRAKGILIDD